MVFLCYETNYTWIIYWVSPVSINKEKKGYNKIEVKHDSCYFSIGNVQGVNKKIREKKVKYNYCSFEKSSVIRARKSLSISTSRAINNLCEMTLLV